MRAYEIRVGRKYDFENTDDGDGTGWLIEKNPNDGTWNCTFRDGNTGCDITITVNDEYDEFYLRPANQGETFAAILAKECKEENNNNGDEEGLTVDDIEVGYQYRFENISLEEGSYQKGIEYGVSNWTGWLLSKEQNEDGTWSCHFKDEENGCDMWIIVDNDYAEFYLVDDTYKEGQELEDIEMLQCTEDDDENDDENMGGGRRRKVKRKSSRKPRKTRKAKVHKVKTHKAKAKKPRKAKTTKRRKSVKSRKNKST